ncbi:MAG: AMP-binding protein, partial [Deltaproteobacteria bacterium]|nr:AMP-binding protein [Deltaproteobacteria bacterium]
MFKDRTEYLNYTLPQLIVKRNELHGAEKVAIREKEFGIWQEYSWRDYCETMKFFGLGILSLGFKPEEVVGMITDNCFMWMASQMGIQAIGGLSACIYQTSVPKEIEHVLSYTKAVFMVAQDQEQVDKVIEVRDKVPSIRKVIFIDPKGMRGYLKDDWFIHIDDLLDKGREFEKNNPGLFEETVRRGQSDDVCHLALTSGTTKLPKIAMLTHRNFINMILSAIEVDPIQDQDDYVSFLPPAWVGEQWATAGMPQISGLVINCPDEVETAMDDLKEIGPHFMFGPPKIWEGFCSRIQVDIEDATWLKRLLFNLCMKIGYRVVDRKFAQEPVSLPLQLLNKLTALIMFRPLRARLGLLRLRRAYTGGAALGPDMFRFFHALGVNLKQVYGQTESCGMSTTHPDDEIRFETVGPPVPNTEIRISEEGEIQVKNPSLFKGYYQMPEETEKAMKDGWLCSGDAGYFDEDGHLVVIDRVNDVMHIVSGEMFSPQFIENKLKFSPYITEAVAFGDGLPYVAAFINIDMEVVGKWAEKRKLPYNTYMDLSQKAEVGELIYKEVAFVNTQLPDNTNIKKFVLLYKELDADDEE